MSTFREFMLAGFNSNFESGLKTIDALNSLTREKQKAFLEYSLRLIRENTMIHFNDSSLNFMNKAEEEFSVKFSKFVKGSNVIQLTEEFNKAAYDIERNGNSKIILFDLLLKTGRLLRQ